MCTLIGDEDHLESEEEEEDEDPVSSLIQTENPTSIFGSLVHTLVYVG